jgi:hypothetical protein
LSFSRISEAQQEDQDLLQAIAEDQNNPKHYCSEEIHGIDIVFYKPSSEAVPKIYLPESLRDETIAWYHEFLSHPGITRLLGTIKANFYCPLLTKKIEEYVKSCHTCQVMKAADRGNGELPPKDAEETPFDTVCVDLISPWKFSIFEEQKTIELNALSIIDPVTGLTEFSRINSKEATYIATEFTLTWLQRYLKPRRCIHDNGSEFIGAPFQQMLTANGIHDVPTTVKNPMSNGICERSHQTIANHLRTIINDKEIPTIKDAGRILDICLATAQYAIRATIHQTLKTTPGALVFNRDMLLPIPFHHNFAAIRQRCQQLIDPRISHDYQSNEEVLILNEPDRLSKLAPRASGPFRIIRVHTYGTLTIRRQNNLQRINIRCVRPYFRRPPL